MEGGALGATKTAVDYTQSGEFLTRRTTTATTGSTVTVGPHTPTVWGDVPDRPIGGLVRTATTTDEFANTASDWTIGKLTGRTVVYAAPGEATKTVDATFAHRPGSRVVSRETRLPNHASLTLTTSRTFTAAGHVAAEQVSGDGVAARTTSFGAYAEGRYPSSATNPLGHRTGFGYDMRHGAPKSIVDPDGRVATREYDAFGRVVRSTAADGTVATTRRAASSCSPRAGRRAWRTTMVSWWRRTVCWGTARSCRIWRTDMMSSCTSTVRTGCCSTCCRPCRSACRRGRTGWRGAWRVALRRRPAGVAGWSRTARGR